ncbi:hypothetical protein WA026_022072 [Henosepilachna vigintioctopunctata]|uniref:Uncharacterized protein n=1 Tax=Henosepilachna vigintioctopunctata TaxID=420089 RepID=A0AAW1UE68_9CUCU
MVFPLPHAHQEAGTRTVGVGLGVMRSRHLTMSSSPVICPIRRHDAVVNYISRNLRGQGYEVLNESRIITDAGPRKPDKVDNMAIFPCLHKIKSTYGTSDIQTLGATLNWSEESADQLLNSGIIRKSDVKASP